MHNPASPFTRASFLRWHTLTHMYYARLAKPNSPRSLSSWLSFYPEPDGGWIWGDAGADRARKSSPGAEGRVLIQSTLNSSGGMRCHDPFLTIFIPNVSCSLSLFHLPCVCVCDHFFLHKLPGLWSIYAQHICCFCTNVTFWSVFKSFPSPLQIFHQEFGAIWASYKCLYRWTRSQSCLKLVYFKK